MSQNTISAFKNAQEQLSNVKKYFEPEDSKYFEILSEPNRVIEVYIPVQMDDGTTKIFTGYRSQHSDARGPYKGGIRFHQNVDTDEVKALSLWMSIKTATLDLPIGGGKWGVIVDPKTLSKWELERLSRGWVQKLYKYIGPTQDVPAPDVNTTPEIMAWMMDEYSKLVWEYSPGAFTGKPLAAGGSLGRWEATAQWWLFVLESYLERNKMSLKGKKVIIQWAGNAWLTMVKLLKDTGAILVGISDSKSWIYDSNGLDYNSVLEFKNEKKSFTEASFGTKISNEKLLEQASDILIPAALENQITKDNAWKIQASLILELANGPTTPEADAILWNKGIPVIPDILANAGWVTVSYFEQVQNNTNYYWEATEVQEKLEKKMKNAAKSVFDTAESKGVNLRQGAYIVALRRIIDAMQAQDRN